MDKPRWYQGVPPIDIVAAHATRHARTDGITLKQITVSRGGGSFVAEVADDWLYGDWLCRSNQPFRHVELVRLREHRGEVLVANGITFWQQLADFSLYFPVAANGLPLDYRPGPTPKVKISDAAALLQVRPYALRDYLVRNGWDLSNKPVRFGKVFKRPLGDRHVEVWAPDASDIGDYVQRIADAIANIALQEDRSQLDIWKELVE